MVQPTHLDDGAYATLDETRDELVLTANHHDPHEATDRVVLSRYAFQALVDYVKRTERRKEVMYRDLTTGLHVQDHASESVPTAMANAVEIQRRTARQRYVAGLMLDHSHDQVLLIHKLKPDWQRGKLNAVGGKVEDGETPYDAMVREFREETGLDSLPGMWDLFCRLEGEDFLVFFYRACQSPHRFGPRRVEAELPEWVSVGRVLMAEVPTVSNLRWLVPMAFSSSAHDWPYRVEERSQSCRMS